MLDSGVIKLNIGANLRRLRNDKGLSQEKLAECIEMDKETIVSLEAGRSFVSADSLARISNFFNIEPDLLFKLKPVESFAKDTEIKKEIIRTISGYDSNDLIRLYKIATVLKI